MKNIKNIIINYCKTDDRNPFALMIDGKWGSGKTYFIKEVLKEDIEKESAKKILYVSLNGVSTFSDIYEQLLSEKFKAVKFFKDNKAARIGTKIIKSASNIFLNALRINIDNSGSVKASADPKTKDLPSISAQEFTDFSDNIIVFDDIERLSPNMSILDILGFANTNFIEHDKIKVIIIGDTSEIKNSKLEFEKEKEKVIGRILRFKPTIEEVLNQYLDKFSPGFPLRKFLESEKSFLLKRIEQAKITNLRTCFFFLDSFKQIFDNLDENEIKYLGEEILLFTLVCANEFKKGDFIKMINATGSTVPQYSFYLGTQEAVAKTNNIDEQEDKDYELQFRENYYQGSGYFLLFYDSISEFINTGVLDIKRLKEDLKNKLPEKLTPEVEALKILSISKIDDLTDEIFIKNVDIIIKAIESGEFNFQYFVSAVNQIEDLLYLGYSVNNQLIKHGVNEEYWIKNFKIIEGKLNNQFLPFSIRHDHNKEPYFKSYSKFSKLIKDYNQRLFNEAQLEGTKKLFKELKESPSSIVSKNSPRNAFEFFPRLLLNLHNELSEYIADLINNESRKLIHIIAMFSEAYSKELAGWVAEKRDFETEKKMLSSLKTQLNEETSKLELTKLPLTKKRIDDLLSEIDKSISTLEEWINRETKED